MTVPSSTTAPVQQLRSCFHIPGKEQLTPTYFHHLSHRYAYFTQTVSLIHVPSFSTQLKASLTLSLTSIDTLIQILNLLFDTLKVYHEQYEMCKASIQRDLSLPQHMLGFGGNAFRQKQKVESLKRQLEELETHRKEVYGTVRTEFESFFSSISDSQIKRAFVQWLLDSTSKLSSMIFTPPASQISTSKKYRTEFSWSNTTLSALEIVDRADQNQLFNVFLSLLRISVVPDNSAQKEEKIIHVRIPNSRNDNISTINDVLESAIDSKYDDLFWAVNSVEQKWVSVYLALQYPLPIASYSLGHILLNIHEEIKSASSNYFEQQAFTSLVQKLYARPTMKTCLVMFENLCQKFPLLTQAMMKQHIHRVLLSGNDNDVWQYQNELLLVLMLTLLAECKGFLRVNVPDLMQLIQDDSHVKKLRRFIPYSLHSDQDDVFGDILCRRIDEFGGSTYQVLSLLESLSAKYSGEVIGTIAEMSLQKIVAQFQRDSILLLVSKTQDVNHNVEMKSLASLRELTNNVSQVMEKVLQHCKSGEWRRSVWLFVLEIIGLIGAESSSSAIAVDLFFNYSLSDNTLEPNQIGELYLHLFSAFSSNLHSFDQMVLDKIFWELSMYDRTPEHINRMKNISHNLCVWVDYLKLRDEGTFVYKNYLYRMTIMNWQMIYPFFFGNLESSGTANQVQLVEMFHTVLDYLEVSNTSVPRHITTHFSMALVSLFFFLLQPTIAKTSAKFASANQSMSELPVAFSHPEVDPSSFLYYHYYSEMYMRMNSESIDCFKKIICVLLGKLMAQHAKVAANIFDFILDLIFANQTESRLNPQKVVLSKNIFEQCNFPLHEHNTMLDLLNDFFPKLQRQQQQFYQPIVLSISDIKNRSALVSSLLSQQNSTGADSNEAPASKQTLLNEIQEIFNPKSHSSSSRDGLASMLRTKGVVVVNPKKVQLHLRSKNRDLMVRFGDEHRQQIIEQNEAFVILLLTYCLQAPNATSHLANQLMKRLRMHFPVTTYEQYRKSLPKKPMLERDIFMTKMFLQFPILYLIFDTIAEHDPEALLRFDTIIISLIANLIGEWHAILPHTNVASDQKLLLARTLQVVSLLKKGQWLCEPFGHISDLLPYLSPHSLVDVLLSLFHFIYKNLPTTEQFTSGIRVWPQVVDMAEFLQSVKDALRQHVATVPHLLLSVFFTPKGEQSD